MYLFLKRHKTPLAPNTVQFVDLLQKSERDGISRVRVGIAMSYEQVKNLKPEDFKRLCGVQPETFTQMVILTFPVKSRKVGSQRGVAQ